MATLPLFNFFLFRHARGDGVDTTKVRTKFKAKEQARREERVEFANVQAARAEVRVALISKANSFLTLIRISRR